MSKRFPKGGREGTRRSIWKKNRAQDNWDPAWNYGEDDDECETDTATQAADESGTE